ncbi:unnamed protein product [Boreogadus saida]
MANSATRRGGARCREDPPETGKGDTAALEGASPTLRLLPLLRSYFKVLASPKGIRGAWGNTLKNERRTRTVKAS